MLSFTIFLSLLSLCLGKTVTYNWSIEFVNAAPDNFTRQVIGINGAWPCPPIEATVGDQVVVHVTNNLGTQSTGLHFHGLNQFGTQVMDGPSGVTQCPIPPGSSFTYSFTVCFPRLPARIILMMLSRLMRQGLTGITHTIWDSTPMD
jgi:iron transport multicopper oxidase